MSIIIILIILFIVLILNIIYYKYSQNKNKIKIKTISHINKNKIIPKIIFQTYNDKSKIPQKVYDNIKQYAPEYQHIIYDDNEIINFLSLHYPSIVVDKFKALNGAHKADLFRYCILYIHGGVYIDIKTELITPLSNIFNKPNIDLYTVMSVIPKTIYQGIIASPPKNIMFIQLINFILNTPLFICKIFYHIFVYDFYRYISNDVNNIQNGYNKGKKHTYYLFNEKCSKDKNACYDGLDRYGLCCFAYDMSNSVFKIRYADYPW